MQKVILVFAFLIATSASAQTFTADLESARLGEAVIQVKINATKNPGANLETVGSFEKIDQGVYGDFLCVNTLNFAKAGDATISLQSRSGDVWAKSSAELALRVQDITRSENEVTCASKDLTGVQEARLASHDLFSSLVLKDHGNKRLVLRVDFFYMNKGLSVRTEKIGQTYQALEVNYSDLVSSSDLGVLFHLVEETKDAEGRVTTSFLEQGFGRIRN